jgi:hypothetical protein
MTRHIPREGKRQPKTKYVPQNEARDENKSHLSFSFKYFKQDPPDFSIEGKNTQYFLKVLDRLTVLSLYSANELRMCGNKTLRCHPIDWEDTTQSCFDIPGEDQLVDQPWQFSVSANAHGRVMGFFLDNIFYIVWFDHKHEVYARR